MIVAIFPYKKTYKSFIEILYSCFFVKIKMALSSKNWKIAKKFHPLKYWTLLSIFHQFFTIIKQ